MTGIIDRLSWPAHQGSRPSPGLGDGLRWTGLNGGGINQKKQNPVLTSWDTSSALSS